MAYENHIKFIFQSLQIKLYWNTARLIIYALSVAAFAQQQQS